MMRLAALLFLLSSVAFADPGIDAATAQCNRILDSNLHLECISAVSRAYTYNVNAVAQCERISDATYLTNCIVEIAGPADDAAVAQCGRISDTDALVRCLGAIARKSYRPSDIQECSGYIDTDGLINCLSMLGQPYGGTTGGSCDQAGRSVISNAISNIQTGNYAQAIELLNLLLR
jgi:hypothetical protein